MVFRPWGSPVVGEYGPTVRRSVSVRLLDPHRCQSFVSNEKVPSRFLWVLRLHSIVSCGRLMNWTVLIKERTQSIEDELGPRTTSNTVGVPRRKTRLRVPMVIVCSPTPIKPTGEKFDSSVPVPESGTHTGKSKRDKTPVSGTRFMTGLQNVTCAVCQYQRHPYPLIPHLFRQVEI